MAIEKDPVLVWFKNDLRIHDNEMLCQAVATGFPLVFLYVIDIRNFEMLALGFRKADVNRAVFLKQSLEDLRKNLEKIGGHLIIETGLPEEIIPKFVEKHSIKQIFAEEEYAWEELQIIRNIESNLNNKCELIWIWGKTLYHIDDIPFSIDKIPLTSKAYRIPTGKNSEVRQPFKDIVKVNSFKIESSKFPEFKDLGFSEAEIKNAAPYLKGGETEAIKRLEYYTFETELLTGYRWSRNRSLGLDYSSKFSPYLALGCISARTIYQKIKHYEQTVKKNQSTWWIVFELVWRDYFTFKGMKMGNQIFMTEGFKKKELIFENDTDLFARWCKGLTGLPFVDAHMRQLNQTGYMSNRGRVNCASFLVHDYKTDWTWGAAYFESKLIDYDVSANWMNWHMQAYEIWYTNPIHQSNKYKAKEFIQKYIPELAEIESNLIYVPWHENADGIDKNGYPIPVEIFKKWDRSINLILKSLDSEK